MISPKYVLRTGYGEYSSGTEVEILAYAGQAWDKSLPTQGMVVVYPMCETDPEASFDCPVEIIIKRRNRTDFYPDKNRKERRAEDPIVEIKRETWKSTIQATS